MPFFFFYGLAKHFLIKLIWVYSRMLRRVFLFKFLKKNTPPQLLSATWLLMTEGELFSILIYKRTVMTDFVISVHVKRLSTNLEQIRCFSSLCCGFLTWTTSKASFLCVLLCLMISHSVKFWLTPPFFHTLLWLPSILVLSFMLPLLC